MNYYTFITLLVEVRLQDQVLTNQIETPTLAVCRSCKLMKCQFTANLPILNGLDRFTIKIPSGENLGLFHSQACRQFPCKITLHGVFIG